MSETDTSAAHQLVVVVSMSFERFGMGLIICALSVSCGGVGNGSADSQDVAEAPALGNSETVAAVESPPAAGSDEMTNADGSTNDIATTSGADNTAVSDNTANAGSASPSDTQTDVGRGVGRAPSTAALDGAPPSEPTNDTASSPEVTCDGALVLETNCAGAACHAGGPRIDLVSSGVIDRLLDVPSDCGDLLLIDSTDPERSYLLNKVSSQPECGTPMPVAGSLSADDLACLEAWVTSMAQ